MHKPAGSPGQTTGPRRFLRPALAMLPPLVALILQWQFWDVIHPFVWFLFYPAVFVSSWISGLRAGLAATVVSTALVWWFFIPPEHSFVKEDPKYFFPAAVFIGMGVLFSLFHDRLRAANQQAADALAATRAANEEITRLYTKTKELDELKTQFFASVSHELRTPLALILGPTERMLASPETTTAARRDLEVLARNARTLIRHVDDLLDVSKLEAGRAKAEHADTDLVQLVRVVGSHFETLAQDRRMTYVIETPEALRAEVDPDKLRRVLLNLLSNAFKFTPAGGRVRLTLRADRDRVILEIGDSGPGIPSDKREAVFERFRQLEGGTARRFGGTGLGLAIARDFVALHGGTLSVFDAPEGGSLFVADFPLLAPPGATLRTRATEKADIDEARQVVEELRGRPEAPAVTAAAGPLILVIEDNREMSRFICEVLAAEHRLARAFDGKEGLTKALELEPDLILCDIMMPELGGDELVHAIRAHPELDATPIVLLSAKADDELRARLLREGAQDYVMKPFSIEELRARVGGLLERKAASEALRRSERRYRELVEQAPDGIFVADRDGRYTEVNGAGCRMLGYAPGEIVGKTIVDLIPAADIERLRESKRRLLRGEVEVGEWALERRDGSYLPVEVSARILPDGRWQGFVRDISKRKRMEQALRESYADLNRAQAVARTGSWRLDLRRNELRWSDEAYRIFGTPRGTPMTYEAFLACVHPEDREYVDRRWKAVLAGEPYDIEHRIVVGGAMTWVRERAEVEFDDEGSPLGGIGTVQDITERKRVEEALQKTSEEICDLYNNAPCGYHSLDREGAIVQINDTELRWLGYSREEVVGKLKFPDLLAPASQERFRDSFARFKEVGSVRDLEFDLIRKDGSLLPVLVSASAIRDAEGNYLMSRSTVFDHTERRRVEELTHLYAREQAALAKLGQDALAATDLSALMEEAVRRVAETIDIEYCKILELLPDGQALRLRAGVGWKQDLIGRATVTAGRESQAGFTLMGGRPVIVEDLRTETRFSGPPLLHEHGIVSGMSVIIGPADRPYGVMGAHTARRRVFSQDDVHFLQAVANIIGTAIERGRAEERLRQAAIVFQGTNEAVIVTDAANRIVTVNRAFTAITGYEPQEVIGKSPSVFQSGRHDDGFYRQVWESLARTGQWQGEIWDRRKSGEVFPAWENISVVKDDKGRIVNHVALLSDISMIKQVEEKLLYLAHHDALTGLPNRLLFSANLDQAIEQARRHHRPLALMFLDLDRFKLINDTLGHAVGDCLLQQVAQRLRASVRAQDTVSRLGGDEFMIIAAELDHPEDAATLADKLLAAFGRPFAIDSHELIVGASIGIGIFPDNAENSTDLAKAADAALYRAKERGRNTYEFYTPELTARALDHLAMEQALRAALEREEFVLYYQPEIDLPTGTVVRVEALLRWQHPQLGLLEPETFMAVAEDSGLIEPIGEWVFRAACEQAVAWRAAGLAGRIAVNLSGRQIVRAGLADKFEAILRETGARPEGVELEITESALHRVEQSRSVLERLKGLGLKLAVDDFGAGYSSLSHLRQLPIDTLKIDRSFVDEVPSSPESSSIVEAIITLGHGLRLTVVGEGVETAAQQDFLRALRCDYVQGHLYGRAVPVDEIEALLASGKVSTPDLRELS